MTQINVDIESQMAIDFAISEKTKGDAGPEGPEGPEGPQGPEGAGGVGVPAGGDAGQVLTKASSNDFDTNWSDVSGGHGGQAEGLTKPYAFYSSGNFFTTGITSRRSTQACFANQLNLQGVIVSEDIIVTGLNFGFLAVTGLFARMSFYEANIKTGICSKIFESPTVEQLNTASWTYLIPSEDRFQLLKTKVYFVGINLSVNATCRSNAHGEASVSFGGGSIQANISDTNRKRFFSISHNASQPDTLDINTGSNSPEAIMVGISGDLLSE